MGVRPSSLALGVLALAPAAAAQTLAVDGEAVALLPLGSASTVEVAAGADLPVVLFGDLDPGPTSLFGQSVELGFGPATMVLATAMTDGAGELSLPFTVTSNPSFVGFTLFVVGAVVDPGAPQGVVFTNGAEVAYFPAGVVQTQLAGNSLATYPHFEFVSAFNADATIEVGVDPALQPHVGGRTADVYVTPDKDAAGWDADPSLVDLTLDGVDTVTFGSDLTSSRFVVDAGTLEALAGTQVGVGYDMVVDMNRNGVLDAGDLVDGYAESGLYAVRDVTQAGPHAVVEAIYSGGTLLGQNLYYPADIASLGELPLVIVSHGNGHNYQWYDHIGYHMASYGYVVMSHTNNTIPGIETASTTTLTNTDYLLGNLDIIQGGALLGHVDKSKMIWIGHSRGGEGVVRAYDRIFEGSWVPAEYTIDDIVLVSSIAPTDFLGPSDATPHGVDYHLWVGGADNDVSGCANNNIAQSFHLHDRAEDQRLSISLHGVGHGDFHDGGGSSVAAGPCLVGRPTTHDIMRGYLVPLFDYHVTGSPASKDFLWRQWERFHPIGAPADDPCVVVDLQFRQRASDGKLVIDDFQSNPDPGLASSGAVVTNTFSPVDDYAEGRLDDTNSNFTEDPTDPFNGFTYGRGADLTAGISFQWDQEDRALSYELAPGDTDWSGYDYLSFRAAQAPRDILTIQEKEDLVFRVALADGSGRRSAVSVDAWGGGVEEPYDRSSCGIGSGWGADFETVRVRLTDFLHDGTGLDLSDVARVEFLFGPSHGSPRARLGMDDIEVIKD